MNFANAESIDQLLSLRPHPPPPPSWPKSTTTNVLIPSLTSLPCISPLPCFQALRSSFGFSNFTNWKSSRNTEAKLRWAAQLKTGPKSPLKQESAPLPGFTRWARCLRQSGAGGRLGGRNSSWPRAALGRKSFTCYLGCEAIITEIQRHRCWMLEKMCLNIMTTFLTKTADWNTMFLTQRKCCGNWFRESMIFYWGIMMLTMKQRFKVSCKKGTNVSGQGSCRSGDNKFKVDNLRKQEDRTSRKLWQVASDALCEWVELGMLLKRNKLEKLTIYQ